MLEPPAFLARAFRLEDLEDEESTIVVLDRAGTIAWVNGAWGRFARENGAEDVARRFGVGRPYLEGISGALRDFYAEMFEQVHTTGIPWEQQYECSSPAEFRLLRLRAAPIGTEGLLLEHSPCVRRPHQHEHSAAGVSDVPYRNKHGLVVQCSNCRRVQRIGNVWHWVEAWVAAPPPGTSHGLCAPCAGLYVLNQSRKTRHRRSPREE